MEASGITAESFGSYVARLRRENLQRVREGDLDHLVFYLLQSAKFTTEAPIEPAVSAKSLVDGLDAPERERFLKTSGLPAARVAEPVRNRIRALARALDQPGGDARLAYFRGLAAEAAAKGETREAVLEREYLRAMGFVYEKEFVAQRSERPAEAVADLYRTRGLSTDTAIEAGYLVHLGLAVVKGLDPNRRVTRVLIVGPGLDLAPRTSLQDSSSPESYQPWAVIDALVSLELADLDRLQVVGADINPRVVEHLRNAARQPPTLTMTSELAASPTLTFSPDFLEYFEGLGAVLAGGAAPPPTRPDGHLRKTVRISAAAARALRATALDIVTERLTDAGFDLVIATNILPYFDDRQLALVTANIAAMLVPGGIFLHNEARPLLGDLAAAVGLPFEQSRHAVIATVAGAKAPLFDSAFIHRKR